MNRLEHLRRDPVLAPYLPELMRLAARNERDLTQRSKKGRELARAVCDGDIDLAALETMTDGAVRSRLTRIRGIGPWTAEIYLLMGLLRPDTWPSGDLALATAVHEIKGLASRPGPAEMAAIARPWRPWRAVAARVLWHYYLNGTR